MTHRSPKLPPAGGSPREVATAVAALANGRSDAYGELTLTANTARTVVTDPAFGQFGPNSIPCFVPKTANAATAFGSGAFWVSARGNGTLTIEHPNTAHADKTFGMSWQG